MNRTSGKEKSRRMLTGACMVLAGLMALFTLDCSVSVPAPSPVTVPHDNTSRHFNTYFMKQKVWTLGDHFRIVDEMGNPRFMVHGRILTLGDRLKLFDLHGNELAFIKQKLFSLKKQYRIYRNQTLQARILKRITLFKDVFVMDVHGPDDYIIRGDFTDHLYTVIRRGKPVAFISKKWFSWGDSYRIEIDPAEDEVLLLTAAIVIDMASHDGEHHHSQT